MRNEAFLCIAHTEHPLYSHFFAQSSMSSTATHGSRDLLMLLLLVSILYSEICPIENAPLWWTDDTIERERGAFRSNPISSKQTHAGQTRNGYEKKSSKSFFFDMQWRVGTFRRCIWNSLLRRFPLLPFCFIIIETTTDIYRERGEETISRGKKKNSQAPHRLKLKELLNASSPPCRIV